MCPPGYNKPIPFMTQQQGLVLLPDDTPCAFALPPGARVALLGGALLSSTAPILDWAERTQTHSAGTTWRGTARGIAVDNCLPPGDVDLALVQDEDCAALTWGQRQVVARVLQGLSATVLCCTTDATLISALQARVWTVHEDTGVVVAYPSLDMFEARRRRLDSVASQPLGLARPFLLCHGPPPLAPGSGDLPRLPLLPAFRHGLRVGVLWTTNHSTAGLATLQALLHGAAAEVDSGVQSLDLKRADLRGMAAAQGSAKVQDFARAATEWAFDFCTCDEWLRKAGVPREAHTTLLTATDPALELRLCLAACAVQQPTLLVLEDPTRGLDDKDKAALAASLQCFPGACILLSEDREFLRTVCSRTWVPLPCGRMLDTLGTAAL